MTVASPRDDDRVIVVGSGPCGAVAAHRLVERGIRVLLLDAGASAPRGVVVRAAGNTVFRWRDSSALRSDRLPTDNGKSVWYSSLSLGGLSNYWTAAVPRFAPADFTDGERLDRRFRWPVGYEDLAPHYDAAEEHLTVTAAAPIPGIPANRLRHRTTVPPDWAQVVEQAAANGDGVGAIPMAKGSPWMFALRGTEFSSYRCVLWPMLDDPRFELRSGAQVVRVRWSSSTSRVEGVEYVDHATGRSEFAAARAVVLAAGTIDTTTILLTSVSSDFPDGIGNSHGLVGRYLHDHPREWWAAKTGRPMRALAHPIYLARKDHADSEPLMATSHTIGLVSGRQRPRTYLRGRTDRVGVQVFGTMIPRPEFRVSIDRSSTCPLPAPRIELSYAADAAANIESSRARFSEVIGAAGLDVDVIGPFHDLVPGSSVHHAGTVRMHDDPEFGVLDAWNRVHDAPNVVVCDMSAFTTGPEKNPTLTAMALAIRAADRLATDLAGGR